MTIWVLHLSHDYAGDTLYGVYSNPEAAMAAVPVRQVRPADPEHTWVASPDGDWHCSETWTSTWFVRPVEVDAPADPRW